MHKECFYKNEFRLFPPPNEKKNIYIILKRIGVANFKFKHNLLKISTRFKLFIDYLYIAAHCGSLAQTYCCSKVYFLISFYFDNVFVNFICIQYLSMYKRLPILQN